jgi:hypothetical protein
MMVEIEVGCNGDGVDESVEGATSKSPAEVLAAGTNNGAL